MSTNGLTFPQEPSSIPKWAEEEARQWLNLDEYTLLVSAEQVIGKQLEIVRQPLSNNIWGFSVFNNQLARARIFINSDLPDFWQDFALYHELYHLMHDTRGSEFYQHNTLANMAGFEAKADMFAWAVMLAQDENSIW